MRSRNHFVRLLAEFLLISGPNIFADPSETVLRDAFAEDFLIGAAVNRNQVMGGDPKAMRLVLEQFNTLTPENVMKWEKIEPLEGQFDWKAADNLVDFAEKHNMAVAGHVLVWHQQTPDWVFQDKNGQQASRELLLQRMKNHIEKVVGRYRGRIHSWEVVNEALNEDGSLRSTPWLDIIGDDYIEQAFRFAHAADPGAELYYNDYNLYVPEKRAGVVRLVSDLKERGVAVHGIGMQGHYGVDAPEDMQQFEDSVAAFSRLGSVYITELDISTLPFPDQAEWGADISQDLALEAKYNPYADGLPPAVEQQQSRQFTDLFRTLLKYRDSVSRVTFWGVSDRHSWKNNWPMAGRTDYPLLFDRELKAKPVVVEITALLDES